MAICKTSRNGDKQISLDSYEGLNNKRLPEIKCEIFSKTERASEGYFPVFLAERIKDMIRGPSFLN